MKNYHSRQELEIDVQFIKAMIKDDYVYRHQMINALFDRWRKTSPDSPWYEGIESVDTDVLECANTLVKISQGSCISSEWCGEHIVFEDVGKSGKSGKSNNRYNLRPR